jgi:hypothetical protein
MLTMLTVSEIQLRLDALGPAPQDTGSVELLVARPDRGERLVLDEATFDLAEGMVGDNWRVRGSRVTTDGSANPEAQVTLMNRRIIEAIEPDRTRWPLAGDQIFVDFDLSAENLPAGQRIALGSVILEVSATPHTGCDQFTERFGSGAIRFVNGPEARGLRRRGINARVIQPGLVRVGDSIRKVATDA